MRAALVVAFASALAQPAWADAVEVSLTPRALIGKGQPSVQVHIREPIAGFELRLKRSDGKDVVVRGGGRPGVTRTLPLPQPEGTFSYTGELAVQLPNAERLSMPLEFEAEVAAPLKLGLDKRDVDLDARRLRFTLSRPAGKAHLTVVMDSGQVAIDEEGLFNREPPGTPLELTWPEAAGRVMRISLRAFEAREEDPLYDGVELFQIEIPHHEVNFDTGKWDIRADQQRTLDQSHRLIADTVAKNSDVAALRLYVIGHTDTVGRGEDSRALSLNRARSIAVHFRKRGLRIPIFYDGFGEDALWVATPDETDEPRNRRTQYILSLEDPVLPKLPFAPRWRKL